VKGTRGGRKGGAGADALPCFCTNVAAPALVAQGARFIFQFKWPQANHRPDVPAKFPAQVPDWRVSRKAAASRSRV
jgi:hypothetical protein